MSLNLLGRYRYAGSKTASALDLLPRPQRVVSCRLSPSILQCRGCCLSRLLKRESSLSVFSGLMALAELSDPTDDQEDCSSNSSRATDGELATMWRIVFIAFFLAHGGIHLAIWATPTPKEANVPFDPTQSWLVGSQRGLAMLLALAAAGFLVAAGVGLWIGGPWWRTIAVAGLASSLVLMILFSHTWFLPIQVVNAGLLIRLLWLE